MKDDKPLHKRSACQGGIPHHCPWHNPSAHKMRGWPRNIRFDKHGLVERICEHGVGHPDPDSLSYLYSLGCGDWLSVHGCEGCCGIEENKNG